MSNHTPPAPRSSWGTMPAFEPYAFWQRLRGEDGWIVPLLFSSLATRSFGIVVSALAFCVAITIAITTYRRRAPIQRLAQELPWFRKLPVTVHPMPPAQELHATLQHHGWLPIELDGTRIRSPHDLAASLQERLGALRWPSQPLDNAMANLRRLAATRPLRRALVWRNANVAMQADPAFVTAFLSQWATEAPMHATGLLLFVDAPAAPPTAPSTQEQTPASVVEPSEQPWWQRHPGELTT